MLDLISILIDFSEYCCILVDPRFPVSVIIIVDSEESHRNVTSRNCGGRLRGNTGFGSFITNQWMVTMERTPIWMVNLAGMYGLFPPNLSRHYDDQNTQRRIESPNVLDSCDCVLFEFLGHFDLWCQPEHFLPEIKNEIFPVNGFPHVQNFQHRRARLSGDFDSSHQSVLACDGTTKEGTK